jgi:hypothetical protein
MVSSSGPNLMPSCAPDLGGGNLELGYRRAHGMAQFLARKNGLQRDRRLGALMRCDVRVQCSNDLVRHRSLVGDVRNHFLDFRNHDDARLQAFCRPKIREQTL